MWAVDGKLISILAIVGHKIILLDHSEGQYVSYSPVVISYRIGIYRGVTKFFGVCHSYATMDK